jgi:hypothetical protein
MEHDTGKRHVALDLGPLWPVSDDVQRDLMARFRS